MFLQTWKKYKTYNKDGKLKVTMNKYNISKMSFMDYLLIYFLNRHMYLDDIKVVLNDLYENISNVIGLTWNYIIQLFKCSLNVATLMTLVLSYPIWFPMYILWDIKRSGKDV